jgi:outer membrane protein insertion porin family
MKRRAPRVTCRIWICVLPLFLLAVHAQSPVLISSISFDGNKSIAVQQLKTLLRTSAEGSPYSEGNLQSDLQAIENFYRDEGFLRARVGPPDVQFRGLAGHQAAVIRVPVSEGPAYSTGNLEIRNAHVFETQTLFQMLSLKKGQTFSRNKIFHWQQKVEDAYHTMGYIRFRSLLHENVNETTKTVDAAIEFTEGKAYSVGKISVVGDDSISLPEFKRRLLIGEGGLFNPDLINTTIYYLNQTHRYQPVSPSDVEIRIDDANGTVDLAWHLKARRLN